MFPRGSISCFELTLTQAHIFKISHARISCLRLQLDAMLARMRGGITRLLHSRSRCRDIKLIAIIAAGNSKIAVRRHQGKQHEDQRRHSSTNAMLLIELSLIRKQRRSSQDHARRQYSRQQSLAAKRKICSKEGLKNKHGNGVKVNRDIYSHLHTLVGQLKRHGYC